MFEASSVKGGVTKRKSNLFRLAAVTDSSISFQGNMQRCKLVMDQINEARDSMLKVLDHKDRVLKLLNKNGTVKKVSKLKRKEKV